MKYSTIERIRKTLDKMEQQFNDTPHAFHAGVPIGTLVDIEMQLELMAQSVEWEINTHRKDKEHSA